MPNAISLQTNTNANTSPLCFLSIFVFLFGNQAEIQSCLEEVEQVIAANNAILLPAKALPLTTNGCLQNGAEPMPLKACPKSKAVIASAGQPETPTDVQDIHF